MIDNELPTLDSLPQVPEPEVQEPQQQEQEQQAVGDIWSPTRDKMSRPDHPNFAALRQQKERLERERDEALRQIQELQSKQQPQTQPEDEEIRVGDEDIVEGKHLAKALKRMRKLEEELRTVKQQSNVSSAEARLKMQYPDFDQVVNKENIDILNATEPELAATLNASPDLYAKAVSAYKLIKNLGIKAENPYQSDVDRAQRNAAKPKPLASIAPQQGDSPLSRANAFANGLTEDLKKQLLKEMMEVRKNY